MKTGTAIGIGCGVVALLGLGCLGLFGGLAWMGIGMYKDTTGAADSFLARIGSGDIPGAYQSGSSALKQQQTLEQFTASVKALGLTEYQSATWSGFNIVNDQATIDGSMTTKKGGSVVLKVTMAKEDGTWRVSGVTAPAGGVIAPKDEKGPPVDEKGK